MTANVPAVAQNSSNRLESTFYGISKIEISEITWERRLFFICLSLLIFSFLFYTSFYCSL